MMLVRPSLEHECDALTLCNLDHLAMSDRKFAYWRPEIDVKTNFFAIAEASCSISDQSTMPSFSHDRGGLPLR